MPIYNLMEDAATAEISRTQVWQWVRHGARLDDGRGSHPTRQRASSPRKPQSSQIETEGAGSIEALVERSN